MALWCCVAFCYKIIKVANILIFLFKGRPKYLFEFFKGGQKVVVLFRYEVKFFVMLCRSGLTKIC